MTLKEVLDQHAMSQSELARRLKVSPQLVSYWVRAGWPQWWRMATIADALGVTPESLAVQAVSRKKPKHLKK